MKKRVLSALLVLCMACGLVSTAWAADGQATRETAEKPGIMLLNAEDVDQQTASDSAATPAPTAEPTAEPSATPNATEAPEATATPAPENSETAENETNVAEPTATPATTPDEAEPVEYTAALEQDGQALNVVVTAPADAFGEDVQPTLNVTAIEDETQAADIEAKLTENNIEYDGFVALDIHFTDADGNEIEPAEPVTVRIELPDSIIDSGIDLNTLAVQHFAEDEAGNVTSVDQVASVADNTIVLSDEAKAAMEAQAAENAADPESTEEAGPAPMMLAPAANNAPTTDNGDAEETEAPVVAEFEVSGFSRFTITWRGYSGSGNGTVQVVFWDATNNRELGVQGLTTSNIDLTQGDTYTSDQLQTIIDSVTVGNGYTYSSVTVGYATRNRGWQEVYGSFSRVQASYHQDSGGWFDSSYWYYTVNGQEWNTHYGTPVIHVNYTQPLQMFRGEDTEGLIDIDLYNYTANDDAKTGINFDNGEWRPFQFNEGPGTSGDNQYDLIDKHGAAEYVNDNVYYKNHVNQDIVQNKLGDDGYPVLTDDNNTSLGYLFGEKEDTAIVDGKEKYNDVNYLFQLDDEGYYYYDSSQYFATVMLDENGSPYSNPDENTNDIWLYGRPGDGIANSNQAFMPFNTLNRRYSGTSINDLDYLFGMKVGFTFLMPENGQVSMPNSTQTKDMTFEFAGDDDVWVFIDGNLVLDIGGIHDNYQGSINFATGDVYVQNGNSNGTDQTLKIWNILEEYGNEAAWREAWTYEEHTLTFFYFERGGGDSNCKIKFNMPMIPDDSVTVTKRVSGDETTDGQEYTLQFIPEEGTDTTGITVSETTEGGEKLFTDANPNGTFTIRGGETKYINNIPAGTKYQIREISVPDSIASVSIDGVTATISEDRTATIENEFSSDEKHSVVVTNAYPIAPPEDFEGLNVFKTAVEHPDDENSYDLTLSVTGDTGSVNDQTELDVLFILDDSNSMSNDDSKDVPITDKWGHTTYIKRQEAANDAIRTLVTDLENNQALDVQYGLIRFSGSMPWNDTAYNDAASALNNYWGKVYWTAEASDLIGTQSHRGWTGGVLPTSGGTEGGGTNYEAGFVEAANALNDEQKREDAQTVVIFISDGMPGYYYAQQGGESWNRDWYDAGKTIGNGNPSSYDPAGAAIQRAITACKALDMDYFYTVGVADATSLDALDDLVEFGAPSLIDGTTKDSYMATSMDELQQAFDDIQDNLTSFACSPVVMHDTLSGNVAQLDPETVQFRVFIEQRDPNSDTGYTEITGMSQSVANNRSATFNTLDEYDGNATFAITPSLAADGKTITVTFTDTYQLEPGYRYSVEVVINPSETAKSQYQNADWENDPNLDTADADTGTYQAQKGLYSNDNSNAYVSYQIDSTQEGVPAIPDTVCFPRPVIRVPAPTTGDLTITKSVTGLEGTDLTADGTEFTFTITTKADVTTGDPGYAISGDGAGATGESTAKFSPVTGEKGKYQAIVTITGAKSIKIENLPLGTYTVTETSAPDIGEYYCDLPDASNEAIGTDNLEAKVNISNTYEHYKTVIIQKQVDVSDNQSDIGMGDTTKLFKFTTSIQRGDNAGKAVTDANVANVNDKNSMTLDTDGKEVVEFEMSQPVGTAPDQRNTFDWWTGENGAAGYSLANGGYLKISKLKKGDKIAFNETDANSEGYTTSYVVNVGETNKKDNTYSAMGHSIILTDEFLTTGEGAQAVLNDTVTIVYTNNRKVVTPTGLESNHTKPYALMITAAGIAGLALIGGIVARRIRRRRED